MQLLDLGLTPLPGISTPPDERRGHVLNRRALQLADLVPMRAILLRQLSKRHLYADRFQSVARPSP